MAEKILVTGASGNIGSPLVLRLSALAADVRALVRSAEKGRALESAGAELAVGDFERPGSLETAMDGVATLVLITPSHERAEAQADAALEAAKAAFVKRIVRISAILPGRTRPTDNTRQHAATDEKIAASGMAFTILRPHFFMQNLFMSAGTIGQEGKMYWGMGDGKMGMIDVRDIVAAAANVTMESGHEGAIYTLTGPESISFGDVAAALKEALGKDVSYMPVPLESVREAVLALGAGEWFAGTMRDYSKAYAENWGDFVSPDVERLLGRRALTIDDFAREVFAPALGLV